MEKNNKQKLVELTEYMNEDQCSFIYELINTFSSNMMSKGDVMKIAYKEDELKNIDSAIPLEYQRSIEKLLPSFKSFHHCYNYNKNIHGEMDNISESLFNRLNFIMQNS